MGKRQLFYVKFWEGLHSRCYFFMEGLLQTIPEDYDSPLSLSALLTSLVTEEGQTGKAGS